MRWRFWRRRKSPSVIPSIWVDDVLRAAAFSAYSAQPIVRPALPARMGRGEVYHLSSFNPYNPEDDGSSPHGEV